MYPSAFLKACERSAPPPARPLPPPAAMRPPERWPASAPLDSLGLAAPRRRADGSHGRDWATPMLAHWEVRVRVRVRVRVGFAFGLGVGLVLRLGFGLELGLGVGSGLPHVAEL